MTLSPRVLQLLTAHRADESHERRGPKFVAVVMALEQEMLTQGLTDTVLVSCFGPPDLWADDEGEGLLVYFYDEREAGKCRDEWYFHTKAGRVTASGYNRRGTNRLTGLKPKAGWPLRSKGEGG